MSGSDFAAGYRAGYRDGHRDGIAVANGAELHTEPRPHPLDIACSFCGSKAGEECRTHRGSGTYTQEPHKPRRRYYSDALLGRPRAARVG